MNDYTLMLSGPIGSRNWTTSIFAADDEAATKEAVRILEHDCFATKATDASLWKEKVVRLGYWNLVQRTELC